MSLESGAIITFGRQALANADVGLPRRGVDSKKTTGTAAVSDNSGGKWTVHGHRPIYQSRWIDLGLTDVELPSGERFEHHSVRMPGAAVAAVFDPDAEHVLLSWRHRFVPDLWNYEVPGGVVEDDEDAADTIRREILEETGHEVGSLELLTVFEPMVGMISSPHHVFLARDAQRVAAPVEQDEGTFEWVPVSSIGELVNSGKICNSGTIIALSLGVARL